MEPIVARRSIRQYSWGVVVGVLLGLLSHLLGMSRGYSLLVGLGMAAGPAAYGLVRATLSQEEVLRIDASGIIDHRLGLGVIPWDQISTARRSGGRLYIAIKDPAALGLEKTLWTRMNQPLGGDVEAFSISVRLGGLDVRPDRIVRAVRHQLDALSGGGVTT